MGGLGGRILRRKHFVLRCRMRTCHRRLRACPCFPSSLGASACRGRGLEVRRRSRGSRRRGSRTSVVGTFGALVAWVVGTSSRRSVGSRQGRRGRWVQSGHWRHSRRVPRRLRSCAVQLPSTVLAFGASSLRIARGWAARMLVLVLRQLRTSPCLDRRDMLEVRQTRRATGPLSWKGVGVRHFRLPHAGVPQPRIDESPRSIGASLAAGLRCPQ